MSCIRKAQYPQAPELPYSHFIAPITSFAGESTLLLVGVAEYKDEKYVNARSQIEFTQLSGFDIIPSNYLDIKKQYLTEHKDL